MSQPRKAERVRSLLSAQVIFNKNASTIDCVVKNIASAGARLQIADGIALPTEFDLSIPHKGRIYRARIVWRDDGVVGVEFIDSHAEGASASTPRQDETEADRADRLMKDNARLRAQVLELQQRLAQRARAE